RIWRIRQIGTIVLSGRPFFQNIVPSPNVRLGIAVNDVARQFIRHTADTWLAVLLLLLLFLSLHNRTGAALQAHPGRRRGRSLSGRPGRAVEVCPVRAAGFGCGAAGALTLANTPFIQPQSIFGVQWSAYLIFMVWVGGLGTFEGPIIGAILFFVI